MSERKTCFVIAPIGEADSGTRKRSDQVLKYVITPAANECGYKPLRADQISEPGIITTQVIQHIVEDPLVIADLTGRNPNVFYELAIRHAIKKPLVQIIQKGEQIPFDVAATRTIYVDLLDLDSVAAAKNEIVKQIKAVEKDASKIDTPISIAIDLQILRQSGTLEQRSLGDIMEAVSELRAVVLNLHQKFEGIEGYRTTEIQQEVPEEIRTSELITLKESAEYSGLSYSHLAKLASRGRLKAYKLGRYWVTTREAVDEYMASRKKTGA